ncbi:uncharacterized protein [Palaemon carinicauda]|uniref:uncharacterized protein n=1 Tax=Palaemon carinicauda TaxID=392227 RepID=UPI0035B6191F
MTLELHLHLNEICYYTDSTTVLYYIRAERKRFPVFVANRVRQIRDFSNANQWKYVSTDLNLADIASRGVSSVISSDMTRWLEGPDFLNMPASECPAKMHPSSEPQVTEEDLMSLVTTTTSEEGSPFMTLITYFSRWKREYIVSLQQRPKWNKQQRNTREGDIVLLKDENTPRLHWPLARVTEVLPDSRGVVRSVKLRTQSSELHRPVSKLVLLLPKDQVL